MTMDYGSLCFSICGDTHVLFLFLCCLNLLEVCLTKMCAYSKWHRIIAMVNVFNKFNTNMCMRKKGCTGTKILGWLGKYVLNEIWIMYKIPSYISLLFRWVYRNQIPSQDLFCKCFIVYIFSILLCFIESDYCPSWNIIFSILFESASIVLLYNITFHGTMIENKMTFWKIWCHCVTTVSIYGNSFHTSHLHFRVMVS